MLTLDLVRARSYRGELKPSYIDPKSPEFIALAEDLLSVHQAHIGHRIGDLKEAIAAVVGDGPSAWVGRGLAKLIQDRAVIEMQSPLEPAEVRRQLFERAAPHHPIAPTPRAHRTSRSTILTDAAQAMGTSAETLEASIYADLPDEHKLLELPGIAEEELLFRYNVSLAQAILLRARSLRIDLKGSAPARHRQLFRYIKFFRLMHLIEPLGEGYRVQLDGPLSLFKLGTKYGIQFAKFLPALLLCEHWALEAEVEWGKRRFKRRFKLAPSPLLRSFYPDKGVYQTREEAWFLERFAAFEGKTEWRVEPCRLLVTLGGEGVLAPDFTLRHPAGRAVHMEIIGFWRRNYLERRLELYEKYAPGNLLLAVARQLQGSLEGLEDFKGQIYTFREVIVPKDVVALAEAMTGGAGSIGGK